MVFVRRLHFTLLELMIVLFAILLMAGLTGIKVKHVYEEQRFLTEVQQVASHLQMAQDIMLMLDNDVSVIFHQYSNEPTITYRLDFQKPLPSKWLKILQKEYSLHSIKGLEYEGKTVRFNRQIDLTFFSKGISMSKGKLVLSPKETTRSLDLEHRDDFQIELLGYPHFIESKKYHPVDRGERVFRREPKTNFYPPKLIEEMYEKKKP